MASVSNEGPPCVVQCERRPKVVWDNCLHPLRPTLCNNRCGVAFPPHTNTEGQKRCGDYFLFGAPLACLKESFVLSVDCARPAAKLYVLFPCAEVLETLKFALSEGCASSRSPRPRMKGVRNLLSELSSQVLRYGLQVFLHDKGFCSNDLRVRAFVGQ